MVKHIRNTKSSIKQLFIPGMFFEEMGIIYLGPVDGSDIKEMCRVFDEAKRRGLVRCLCMCSQKREQAMARQSVILPDSTVQSHLS